MPGLIPQLPSTMKFSENDKEVNRVVHTITPEESISRVGIEDFRNGDYHVNGDVPVVNGVHAGDIAAVSSKSNHQQPSVTKEFSRELPPEIEHITSGYVSLSVLIERLAQETFNDLAHVINDMAEIPAEQPRPNGVLNHIHQVNGVVTGKSEANMQKKLLMLNFTHNWRSKFIKILVLSQWARQAEAVSRVIDLKNWEDMQRMEYDGAVTAMGELKRQLVAFKDPSPDIKTALEVLLLGKASWIPDFGYLSPEHLSTQSMLDGFRQINTELSIRLNLHENIPTLFRDYSISSGRVTFRIPYEFEVDLSVAEEDPSSQLFFVDFRLTFSPSTAALPAGILRSELEERANEVLRTSGLQGLLDLLHDFVLSHKLNILKSQAFDMARSYWSEHLVVEPVHRSVVVQYWSNRPGGKNWVEVGIKRGTDNGRVSVENCERISNIDMRYFRAGKEVHGIEVDLNPGNLSMESIVKQVIARHSSHIYDGVANKLLGGLLYSSGCLKVRCNAAEAEPADASLLVQMAATTAIKIVQEPVSGRFAVQPISPLNQRAEYELNRVDSPSNEAAPQLAYLRSLVSVQEVETNARDLGWDMLKSITPTKDEIIKHFANGILQTRFFRRQEWDPRWILAFTTSLEGDLWWVVELAHGKSTSNEPKSQASPRLLKAAYRIYYNAKQSLVFPASNRSLTQVEWTAVGMISQHDNAREIVDELRHTILTPSTGVPRFTMSIRIPKSILSFAERPPSLQGAQKKLDPSEPHETIRLVYKGVNATTRSAVHLIIARLNKPIAHLRDIASRIPNLAVTRLPISSAAIGDAPMEADVFKFMLVNKVGKSCIPDVITRLAAIERLLDYVSILESNSLVINSASLSHIKFTYASIPRTLKATIALSPDGPVKLSFPKRSPHLRVQDYLTSILSKSNLVSVLALLQLTLPILTAFSAIEKSHSTNNDIYVIARSEQWFEVRYSAPLPKGGYNINLRLRRDEPYWFIKESTIRKPEPVANEDAWAQSLRTVTRGKGKGWRGMKGGIVAHPAEGIAEALQKLDEVFRNANADANPAAAITTELASATPAEDLRPGKRKPESQIVEID